MSLTVESIGTTVKKERKRLGVTQKELALTSGTGIRFVSDLENGKSTCEIGKVMTILRTLGISLKLETAGKE